MATTTKTAKIHSGNDAVQDIARGRGIGKRLMAAVDSFEDRDWSGRQLTITPLQGQGKEELRRWRVSFVSTGGMWTDRRYTVTTDLCWDGYAFDAGDIFVSTTNQGGDPDSYTWFCLEDPWRRDARVSPCHGLRQDITRRLVMMLAQYHWGSEPEGWAMIGTPEELQSKFFGEHLVQRSEWGYDIPIFWQDGGEYGKDLLLTSPGVLAPTQLLGKYAHDCMVVDPVEEGSLLPEREHEVYTCPVTGVEYDELSELIANSPCPSSGSEEDMD